MQNGDTEPAQLASDSDALVSRLRDRDESAYKELYLEHYDQLWKLAYQLVKSEDRAEDIVQDAFVSLFNRAERIEIQTSVRAYLMGSVYKASLMEIRKESIIRRARDYAFRNESPLGTASNSESVLSEIMSTERDCALKTAVTSLPLRQRIAFTMRWDGLSITEISEIMGVSQVAVRKLVAKSIQVLSRNLKDY